MLGCVTLPFRLLGFLLFAGLVYLGWTERERIAPYWHRLTDRPAAAATGDAGRPGVDALRRANDRIDSLNGWRADSVRLTAAEMASLVGAGLDARLRGELDSLSVTLGTGRIAVAGRIRTGGLPRELLGPLTGALAEREAVQAAGVLVVAAPGRAEWRIDAFRVRDFDFPREMVPKIVGVVGGAGRDSVLTVVIPPGIGRIRVQPDGVTLYPSGSPP